MKLTPISLPTCLKMAKELSELDRPEEQSTWIYDLSMHTQCETFAIEHRDYYHGFVVIKKGAFGIWLLWISLQPQSRDGVIGALATYMALSYAFDEKKATWVMSDVFVDNIRSNKIHRALFTVNDKSRRIQNKPVITYIMTEKRFRENVLYYRDHTINGVKRKDRKRITQS